MEDQPLRAFASADNKTGEGSGAPKKIDRNCTMEGVEEKRVVVKEESFSSPELDLGVGAALSAAEAVSTGVIAREKCLFTESQWREFQHQVFIFKHFQYGLSVPLQLVLPILKGVADSHGSGFAGLYKQFPSCMSSFAFCVTGIGHLGFTHGKMADPEPQRCRRSDGKKWRCSKNVVPDQKFCERHMHRGRNRSRKHVETSKVNSSLIEEPNDELHAKLGLNTESVVPNPLGIQLNSTSPSAPSSNLSSTVETSSNDRCKHNIISADTKALFSSNVAATGSTMTPAAGPMVIASSCTTLVASNTSNQNTCKKDNNVGSSICNNSSIRTNGKGNVNSDGNKNNSTGIGFSPRSVLQGVTVSGCNHSCPSNSTSGELEPGRCRRTDGKKWRCRNAIVPNQKYCASHLHRGAKKRFTDHEPATIPLPSAVAATTIAGPLSTTTIANIQNAYCRVPNTNLSMSIPASSLLQCNERSTGSSDTDTTITDNMDEYSYVSF